LAVAYSPGPVNNPPTVTITSHADGDNLDSGSTINFAGTASDDENGNITSDLIWTLNNNVIGTGGSFSIILADEEYTITAQVTDSGVLSGSDSVTIIVGIPPDDGNTDEPNCPPKSKSPKCR